MSTKKPMKLNPEDVCEDYMFEEYGLGMDITEDESKENIPSIWCLPIALALTAAVYVITGMIMKRREFLKIIGVAIASPGMITKTPMASGGIIKGVVDHGSVPVFLQPCTEMQIPHPVNKGKIEIMRIARGVAIIEDPLMIGTKILYKNYRGNIMELVVGCGYDDFEVTVIDGVLEVAK